ncbi:MAG: ABC transporter permease, partial [Flavobacteriaceae bacterium]
TPLKIVGSRLLQAIPRLLCTVLANFLNIHAAPGDPVSMIVGEGGLPAAAVAELRTAFGLDQPLYVQFFAYLANVLRGDLGISFMYQQPVTEIIASRLPATLLLMLSAYLVSTLLGLLIGTIAALRPGSVLDRILMTVAVIGYSVPAFWLGFLAVLLFAVELGLFPVSGMVDPGAAASGPARWLNILHHLVLPVSVLSLFYTGLIARLMRASMVSVLRSDFVLTARTMGLPPLRVVLRHAFPNAVTPIITVLGLQIGLMLSGAVLTETVFGWPGLGTMTVQAVSQRDYPLLLGMLFLTSVTVIIANVLTDLFYLVINPKLRANG